jgi:NADPH-dependent ferric siderophore reductase
MRRPGAESRRLRRSSRCLEESPAEAAVRVIVPGGSPRPLSDERPPQITWPADAQAWLDTGGNVPSDVFIWAAGEADAMRALPVQPRDERRVEPARLSIHGHRRVGVAGAPLREEEA